MDFFLFTSAKGFRVGGSGPEVRGCGLRGKLIHHYLVCINRI